jgi:hypothetical protein
MAATLFACGFIIGHCDDYIYDVFAHPIDTVKDMVNGTVNDVQDATGLPLVTDDDSSDDSSDDDSN